mgnify:CR=1 FL=1
MPDSGQRLERLALALDALLRFRASPGDPAAFLAANEDLRDLLEPMLEDAEPTQADGMATPADTAQSMPGPGQLLGDYRLIRELGRGGMGIVFEAEQQSLRRRVALKLLPRERTDSTRSIERFRREAAAASRLHHPGIVPIHEVGEWRGIHFYSMEFVAGTPLDVAMQRERLGVRSDCSRIAEVAEVIALLADALQHAHDHGLVHRDVKPHNVMIGDDGSVRLLDFGLVKDQFGLHHSRTGEFLGTPHYCSPEQITGLPAGPTADVFSLGIVLYELVAGRRPFVADDSRGVMRLVEAGQFPRLRSVAPWTPRDLETICHKALERRPTDRYRTASAMAADLRRFLRIEPILATPPGPLSVVGKWLRRHHLRVVLAATSSLLVVGLPVAYTFHLHSTRASIAHERGQLAIAEEIGFASMEQTLDLLGERLEREPDAAAQRQPSLLRIVELAERFLALRAEVPGRQQRAAQALLRVAAIQIRLDQGPAAQQTCRRVEDLLAQAAVTSSDESHLLQGQLHLRKLQTAQLLTADGGADEFEAARHHSSPLGPAAGWPAAAVQLAIEIRIERAEHLLTRAMRQWEAEPLLQEARELLACRQMEAHAQKPWLQGRVAVACGQLLLTQGRREAAMAELAQAQQVLSRFPASPSVGVLLSRCEAAIGRVLRDLSRLPEAEASLERATSAAERLLQQFPGSMALQRVLSIGRFDLGMLLLQSGRYQEAESMLRLAGRSASQVTATPADQLLAAEQALCLSNCLQSMPPEATRTAEAEQLLHTAEDRLLPLLAAAPAHVEFCATFALIQDGLAALANEQGRHEAAMSHATKAVEHQRRVVAATHGEMRARVMLGMHQAQLAYAAARAGDLELALNTARQAVDNAPRAISALRLCADAATRVATADTELGAKPPRLLAIQILAQIAAVDAKEARRLVRGARFEALREEPAFQELVRKLEGS